MLRIASLHTWEIFLLGKSIFLLHVLKYRNRMILAYDRQTYFLGKVGVDIYTLGFWLMGLNDVEHALPKL